MTKLNGKVVSCAPLANLGTQLACGVAFLAAPALIGAPGTLAMAADECGADTAGPTTRICAPGNYAAGITYTGSDELTVILDDDTIEVEQPGVDVRGSAAGAIVVRGNRFDTITTTSNGADGLSVRNEGGGDADASFGVNGDPNSGGAIRTFGNNADGVSAEINNGAVGAMATVEMNSGTVVTEGRVGRGLFASVGGDGFGSAEIIMRDGTITTNNRSADGIHINNISGDSDTATVLMQGGTINVDAIALGTTSPGDGAAADGILILHRGTGLARAEQSGGQITTNSSFATDNGRGSHGIRVVGRAGGAIATQSGDETTSITTAGEASHGVLAEVTRRDGDTLAQQIGSGVITTDGSAAHGVFAWSAVNGTRSGNNATAEQTGGGTIRTLSDGSAAVYALAESDGDATVTIDGGGTIETIGTNTAAVPFGSHGGFANATNGDALVSFGGGASGNGSIITRGDDSEGLIAIVDGDRGNATVRMTGGSVSTIGVNSEGIVAELDNGGAGGTARAEMTGGTVTTTGNGSAGVLAQSAVEFIALGNATVFPVPVNVSVDATVELFLGSAASVETSGNSIAGAVSPLVQDGADALLAIGVVEIPTGTGPLFTGYDDTVDNPVLRMDVDVQGEATTSGSDADALAVWGVTALPRRAIFAPPTFVVQTPGANEFGGEVLIDVDVAQGAALTATGQGSNGIDVRAVSLWAGDSVLNPGDWGCGPSDPLTAPCGGSGLIDIDVDIHGAVLGGWGVSSFDGTEYAAGLRIDEFGNSDGITINVGETGSLGALSDVAFDISSNAFTDSDDNPLSSGDFGFETRSLVFNNDGTITGSGYFGYNSIQAADALEFIAAGTAGEDSNDIPVDGFVDANTVVNRGDTLNNNSSNSFNFRRFEDTDGDGVRDTEYVAELDFDAAVVTTNTPDGPGASAPNNDLKDGNDIFNNAGTLRLLTVGDAAVVPSTAGLNPGNGAFVSTPQYQLTTITGYDAGVYDIANIGVEQGHIRDLETFNHSGTITMMDMETGGTQGVVGDILVITGNDQIGSFADDNDASGTPLGGGAGVFVSDGGQLRLDTFLNEGAPAASRSDVLVVDRTRTNAATTIVVNNTGLDPDAASTDLNGNGQVDEGEGILLVEVLDGANSADDAFVLQGDAIDAEGRETVLAGAFAYYLAGPGGYGETLDTGSWYLVNELNAAAVTYEALPDAMAALNALPTLQQRVGNRYWNEPQALAPVETVFCKDASKNFQCPISEAQSDVFISSTEEMAPHVDQNAIWTRIEGAHALIDSDISSTHTEIDVDSWQVGAGLDALLSETGEGKLIGGLNAFYGQSDVVASSVLGTGLVNTEGYGVGASLTWYGFSGFYVDAQAQYAWYDNDLNSSVLGEIGDVDGSGYALSLEAGQRLAYSDTVSFTPQAQLVYSSVDFETFDNGFGGGTVELADGDSLRGRLGLSIDHNRAWQGESGVERAHVYGLANLNYEFLDGYEVSVAGTSVVNQPDAWSGEIGLGGTLNWNDDKYSIYGEAAVGTSLQNFGDSYEVNGNVGLRIAW